MDKILQLLRKKRAEPPLIQTEEHRQPLPNFPVEIWRIILQMAIRPSLVIDGEFEPFEIEQAHIYLDSTSKTSERAAQEIVSRSIRNLRGVCRSWKELVDSTNTMWAWDVTRREAGSPISNPYQCTRLNQYHQFPSGSQVNGQYTHPVTTLLIDINFGDYHSQGPIHMTSLKEVISFPEHLRVLNLQLECCRASNNVLRDIEVMHIPLTTLGLCTNSSDILQTSLSIPTLISLFITIPEYVEASWNEHPSRFQWNFPSLRNLWWEDQHLARANYLRDGHPLFLNIIRNHFKSIESLRMYPFVREVADEDSLLCWTKMPNLQALATIFCQLGLPPHICEPQSNSMTINKSDSVLYLVALDPMTTSSQQVVDRLQKYIHNCRNLREIYLLGHPPAVFRSSGRGIFRNVYPSSDWWGPEPIRQLRETCQRNSIQIKYKKGEEFVDIPPLPFKRG
ncbi:hypothetical protein CPB86DRAFT_823584 [Serendipita vermifera]|nr:hypothetical protein CPB86DRAFT_823584 [Serendipita vermifera]